MSDEFYELVDTSRSRGIRTYARDEGSSMKRTC